MLLRGPILPPNFVKHEAVKEWERWKYDLPRRYPDLREMPMLVALGFEHLCKTQGRASGVTEDQGHALFVAQKKATDIPNA